MAEKKEIIIEVEVDNIKAQKRTEDLKRKMDAQKAAINETKKAIKELDKESDTYADDLKKLSASQLAQENALKRTTKEFNIHNKILNANGNSVELLKAQNDRYNDSLRRVDQSTERGKKLFIDLTNAIAANNQKIKDATAAAKASTVATNQAADANENLADSTIEVAEATIEVAEAIEEVVIEKQKSEKATKKEATAYEELNKKLSELKSEYKHLAALEAQGIKLTDEQADRMKELSVQIKNTDKSLKDIDASLKQVNDSGKESEKVKKKEVTAYGALSEKLNLLRKEYRDLAASEVQGIKLTKEQTMKMKALEAQIKETDQALKAIDGSMGQFQRNVGDYKNSINEAISENQGLFASFGNAGGGAADFAGELGNLGKAMLGLVANPIGAVVAILATLVAAFSKTEGGSKTMKNVMAALGQITNKIIGDIGKLAQAIVDFGVIIVKDPVKALETLGEAIEKNVINRIQGGLNLFPALGRVIKEALSGNFEAAGTAAKDAANAFIQFQTGIENMTGKVGDYAGEIADAGKKGIKYREMQEAIDKQNRKLIVSQAELTGALELSRSAMNDDTLGWKARKKAAEDSFVAAEKLADVERQMAKNTLASVNMRIAAMEAEELDVTAMRDEQAQALAAVVQAENNYTQTMRDLGEERRKLALDELESRLDVLVDTADKSKAIAEQQIADGRVDVSERKKLLADLVASENMSTTERISMLNNFDAKQRLSIDEREALLAKSKADYQSATDEFVRLLEEQQNKQIDLNKLLETSSTEDKLRIMKEIDAAERAQNRLREIVQERLQSEQDFTATSNALLDERIATQKAKIEKQVADEMALQQLRTENELAVNTNKYAALDAQRDAELAKYANNEAMQFEISKKYERMKTEMKKAEQAAQLQAVSNTLGTAASLFEENTVAYKALMTAQAIINTYTSATAAFNSMASIPVVGPALGVAAAGVAIASGLANIAKINNVKFADGGMINGKSHAQGGVPFSVGGAVGFEAEGGEYITNKRSTAMNYDAIATINANPSTRFKAVPFASGGAVSTSPTMAKAEATSIQNEFNRKNPIVVTVEDIKRATRRVEVQDKRATF